MSIHSVNCEMLPGGVWLHFLLSSRLGVGL
jgi:hypothetical protein